MITKKNILIPIILLLFLTPWFNHELQGNYSIPKVSQEDTSFYEVNPCKISLFQFISSNTESIYQNHFYFRPNNMSSIKCFGRISGVTVAQKGLETQFFISVGTNSLINLLLQGFFWIFLLTLIPKNKNFNINSNYSFKSYKFISIFLVAYLFTYSIYAESRFYEKTLYVFNFDEIKSYFLIFILFFLISKNLIDTFASRSENVINYLPYFYIATSLFSGFNFSFISTLFIYVGVNSFLLGKEKSRFTFLYFLLSAWWLFNSNGSFYFNVGKLRGFTSSVYEFNANLLWIISFYFLLRGVYKFYKENKTQFRLSLFTKNLSIASFTMLMLGLISSNMPIFNFINYYFLGLQRYGVELKNPLAFDEFGVKISWRGIFPSSETVGEFYGIVLLFLLFWILNSGKLRNIDIFGIFSSSLGLYFSDNRTVIVLVFIFTVFYIYKKMFSKTISRKILLLVGFTGLIIFFTLVFSNTPYKFASDSLIFKARSFQLDSIYSSYLTLINNNYESKSLFSGLFSIFSVVAFFLNRSEMWGLFFSRYNPTFMELLVGSGPLNFGQLYGEIVINNPDSLLLPHSSFLSLIVFFGVVPVLFLFTLFIRALTKNKKNTEFVIFSTYLFINMIKNDSINYLVVFIFYSLMFLVLKNKKRSNLLN